MTGRSCTSRLNQRAIDRNAGALSPVCMFYVEEDRSTSSVPASAARTDASETEPDFCSTYFDVVFTAFPGVVRATPEAFPFRDVTPFGP
jgi:hypothetical protein